MVNKRVVFVLMPFAEKYREVYNLVIKPTVDELGYECVRADEIAAPGNINKDIAEHISQASFIIADLTEANPNVFYELGLSHALGRVTIMIAQDTESLPFDVSAYRVIRYTQSIKGAEKLRSNLKRFIENLDIARKESINPVTEFLGTKHVPELTEHLLTPLECFNSLCQSLEALISQRSDEEDVKLLRALPTEMSKRSFGTKIRASSVLLEKYEALIDEYVEKPHLDDETVFGCPPDLKCLRETLSRVKTSYFKCPDDPGSENLMEVSGLGFHPYLRGYSLFLLGRKNSWAHDPDEFDTGFIFFLNRRGIPVNGIRSTDRQTVRILLHLWHMVLEEILHEPEGIPLEKFQEYRITQNNHVELFKVHIADNMLQRFNKVHNGRWEILIANGGDQVDLKSV